MKDKVQEAFETLKQAMIEEGGEPGSYAHSWHCNIAMMCCDAILDDYTETLTGDDAHRIGNDAATMFMKLCFGVDTKG